MLTNAIPVLFVGEDFTGGVHHQRDHETPGGIGPIPECMFMGQALYIGIWLVVHSFSILGELVRQNTQSIFIFGGPDEDSRLLFGRLGLDERQAQKLRNLRAGEFVCVNPPLFDKAVYANFSPQQVPESCDELLRQQVLAKFMAQVKTTPPVSFSAFKQQKTETPTASTTEDSSKHPGTLDPHALELMILSVTGPIKPLTKLYDMLQVSRPTGVKLTKRLEAIGFICIHTFATGKRGGKISLVEVTEAGWDILNKCGVFKKKNKTNGSWEHETAAAAIEVYARKNNETVDFEIDVGGVRVDVRSTDPMGGRQTLYNIGVSSVERECDSIERYIKLPAANNASFILVVRDPDFSRKVEAELKRRGISDDAAKKVTIKLFTDYLEI
jgi:DNA-binding MarR family transcriptional regulator